MEEYFHTWQNIAKQKKRGISPAMQSVPLAIAGQCSFISRPKGLVYMCASLNPAESAARFYSRPGGHITSLRSFLDNL